MAWFDLLQPASFRGRPFGVLVGGGRAGRRNAVHEYPYRDTPWPEDLGRKGRRFSLTGFLIENSLIYGGGSVIGQRDAMIAAVEEGGDGLLIHPTLGRLNVSLLDFGWTERWDEGRYVEIGFAFIEAGQRLFPSVEDSTGDAVNAAADAMDLAASGDFASRAGPSLLQGAAPIGQAVNTAGAWVQSAQRLAGDATGLFSMASALTGNYGRYQRGRRSSSFAGGRSPVLSGLTTIQALISQGARARGAVTAAGLNFTALAAKL